MYKWSLLLLASAAVFQPIASFTERNLVDGRQQCCDHQPHLLHRDTRLDFYGNYRFNKVASDDRRVNGQRVAETRRYEVRSVETAPFRDTESPNSRRDISGPSARSSRLDRRAVEINSRIQRTRYVTRERFNWVSGQRERDYSDTARVGNDQRSRLSMDSRREQRLLTRETTNMRNVRAFSEGRDLLQRTRNDVVQANIRNRRVSRETEFLNRRSNVDLRDSRRQNVNNINKEDRSLERVRDVSESRLSSVRSRLVDNNRRITRENMMREINLNQRVARESLDERRVRETPESRLVNHRRALNERHQIREDFRQERFAGANRRFANVAERDVLMRTRPESTERSEERQSRKIRENIRENNAKRDAQRSAIEVNRRLVRSVDRSFTRDADIERRQVTRSLDRRSNIAFRSLETRRSSLSRHESRNMIRNDVRRIQNTRDDARDTHNTERRSLDHQTRKDGRYSTTNNAIRSPSEDRTMSHLIRRHTDVRSRIMEQRIDSPTENNRGFRDQSSRTEARRNLQNREQERHENRRISDRRMERSRFEARAIENVRTERHDERFDNRADTRNQMRSNRVNEIPEVLVRRSRELERDAIRTRDARVDHERMQNMRETRNKEVRNTRNADTRDRSETRSRLALTEAARFRREYSTKSLEQESFALNWQYLFYTLQGIYLCGIIATMMKEKPENHKSRSWWGIYTKAVKAD
ncbi:uncharacterized protein PF3D7_1120000-like [Plodia interpunctella]|uniref:uncharacterized protein PF3D7_1120000-like n=1 Tax=Plodia interpunctella TaxID=58824 RepID=UPI0023683EC2|nr:uncharacterized protein PF3D7_1120000-like [Plodia interpunctella]